MIINRKTVQDARRRVQWHKPVIAVVSRGLSFTKDAMTLMGGQCNISFRKENGTLIMIHDDGPDAFHIKERIISGDQPSWLVHSLPLKKLIESLYETRFVRFEVSKISDHVFNLKLIEDAAQQN